MQDEPELVLDLEEVWPEERTRPYHEEARRLVDEERSGVWRRVDRREQHERN
jgi:hypothetical protein